MATEHPLLERVLDTLTLRLIHCNDVWHGELHEANNPNNPIWLSSGAKTRQPVEKSAAEFAEYQHTEVVEL